MQAVVFGSTGAVGKALTAALCQDKRYTKVTAVVRKADSPLPAGCSRLVVDFDNLADYVQALQGHDHIFCALGTTRAIAGSAERFVEIDQHLVVQACSLSKNAANTLQQHLLYVSSAGASSSSPFLYPKSKAQTESRLMSLGYDKTTIMRPGFLEAANRDDTRWSERLVGPIFSSLRFLGLQRASASVVEVARAMIAAANDRRVAGHGSDNHIVSNSEIIALARELSTDSNQ
ncbi:Protein fmp52, mitochondrial [Savitreella phatthalungensis]